MEVYSALFAMVIQATAESNESSFSTAIVIKKLVLDYGDDEIRRAQNKLDSERVEEYAFPSICSPELDSPI